MLKNLTGGGRLKFPKMGAYRTVTKTLSSLLEIGNHCTLTNKNKRQLQL